MKPYAEMTKEELIALRKELKAQYREMQGKDLRLDMSRGLSLIHICCARLVAWCSACTRKVLPILISGT